MRMQYPTTCHKFDTPGAQDCYDNDRQWMDKVDMRKYKPVDNVDSSNRFWYRVGPIKYFWVDHECYKM